MWLAIHFTLIYYFYIIYSARLRLSIGNLVGAVNYTDLVVLGSFIIHNRRMTFNLSFIIVFQQIERIQIMAKCPWALTVTWVYFHRKIIDFEYLYERVHFQVEFNMHGLKNPPKTCIHIVQMANHRDNFTMHEAISGEGGTYRDWPRHWEGG